MDAGEGELLRATGNLELDVFGFVQVAGGFGIEKKSGSVRLADMAGTEADESATPVAVDMLLIGGSGLQAFAGVNGGQANATGLALEGVDFGLAVLGEKLAQGSTATARQWTSLQANVGAASLVGVDGLTATVSDFSVQVNRAAVDATVVDYADGATELTVLTGPAGELASGAFLDFSGNTPTGWTVLPSLNAPAARADHSLVWAGDRLIVWGCTADDVPLNDGAVFCPGCGDWSAISMDNAPLPRGGHAAVWTGTEMMIVGGRNGGSDVSGPASYDPASNLWRTLSGLSNPMARTSATAVWTSTDLLVFGGTSSGTAVANLQRLFPQPEWFFYTKR